MGRGQSNQGGNILIAWPVFWKLTLAEVAVVAVPNGNAAVLYPKGIASDAAGRRYPLATAALRP